MHETKTYPNRYEREHTEKRRKSYKNPPTIRHGVQSVRCVVTLCQHYAVENSAQHAFIQSLADSSASPLCGGPSRVPPSVSRGFGFGIRRTIQNDTSLTMMLMLMMMIVRKSRSGTHVKPFALLGMTAHVLRSSPIRRSCFLPLRALARSTEKHPQLGALSLSVCVVCFRRRAMQAANAFYVRTRAPRFTTGIAAEHCAPHDAKVG